LRKVYEGCLLSIESSKIRCLGEVLKICSVGITLLIDNFESNKFIQIFVFTREFEFEFSVFSINFEIVFENFGIPVL